MWVIVPWLAACLGSGWLPLRPESATCRRAAMSLDTFVTLLHAFVSNLLCVMLGP